MRFILSSVLLCMLFSLLLVQAQLQNEKFNNYNNYNSNNNYNPFTSSAQQVQQQQQHQQQQQPQNHQQQSQQQQQQQHQQQQQQRPIITTANNINTFGHQHQQSTVTTSKPKDQQKDYVDYFDHRYPDGSYEFRYELTDGTARYERGYFMLFDKIKVLVVVGYYSYRSPRNEYITVFYNADHNGYRQNQSITPQVYPNLPRSIDVPEFDETKFKAATQNKRQNFGPTSGSSGSGTTTNKASAYQNQL